VNTRPGRLATRLELRSRRFKPQPARAAYLELPHWFGARRCALLGPLIGRDHSVTAAGSFGLVMERYLPHSTAPVETR